MGSSTTSIWVITPPKGDTTLQNLQFSLYSRGFLSFPGPTPFLPWTLGSIINQELREILPIQAHGWSLEKGFLGIKLVDQVNQNSFHGMFPHSLLILGFADRVPPEPCPRVIWKSLRLQEWLWTQENTSEALTQLEVRLVREKRLGQNIIR